MNGHNLGIRLKELRATKAKKLGRRKIPQREVAEQLHISAGAYGSWESGRTRPDIDLLPRIANYFEVTIDNLLGYSVDPQVSKKSLTSKNDLRWELRGRPETPEENKGVEAWRRLARGEDPEAVVTALRVHSYHDVDCYLHDVIYTDLIIINHLPYDADLAEQVQAAFGLREVVVVSVSEKSPWFFRSVLLGEAARSYFTTHVSEGMKVGIAGGYSVSRLVYSLKRGECRSIEVYPLAISPVIEAISLDANSLVGAFAYRHYGYNVRGYTLQYANLGSLRERTTARKYAPTRRILAKAKTVDIAFMGLGVFGRRRAPIDLLGDLLDTEPGFEELHRKHAVGDVLYHVVNKDGASITPDIDDLICSIDLKDLRELTEFGVRVVVIASGQRKEKIARAVIRAGYANVFIIDDELARALLASQLSG